MEKFIINGGFPLHGEVEISGAKNAALAIIPAAILSQDVCVLENVPVSISDVNYMMKILKHIGANVKLINKNTIEIDSRHVDSYVISHDMTKHLRASYYFIGALLGRFSRARVAMPGGCYLGARPIDQHIKGFELLGTTVSVEDNATVEATAEKLIGSPIYLDMASVGATVNILLAAVKAEGLTVIENAAKEPHIVDLANFLNSMGADIRGAGTDVIKVRGVEQLHGCTYSIIPDQIEAGTYMVAAAATRGDVLIKNVIPKHLESISTKLIECGAVVEEFDDAIRVSLDRRPDKCTIKTMPHPGFPTDMQPQMAVLLTLAEGTSIISESIWSNRFRYAEQLNRMGADIKADGQLAVIQGVEQLKGAPVKADDLRAGAAMLIAGCAASGTTEIEDILHIDRGYEEVVEKFRGIGADIKRVFCPEPNSLTNAG
ncbi:MAG: UDP-N-acetylglucosamine 1-carboxyvinyltransferase [Acutalibacteraceae bacterium]|nr:UDP-N-acetylglucosamine 1-carboxyvinyltransferase [Acutalibacteraceae bacterium]